MKKTFILSALVWFVMLGNVFAATYYVTQSGSGSGLGTDYANSASVSYHNAGTGVFAALDADTVYLCDTITSEIVPPDSGSSGSPVTYRGDYTSHTLDFNHAGVTSNDYIFDLGGMSYITLYNDTTRPVLDGGVTSGSINSSSINKYCIYVSNADHITIDNWEIQNGGTAVVGSDVDTLTMTRCYVHQMRQDGVFFVDSTHITIGGSSANANEFYQCTYKDAYVSNDIGADIRFTDLVDGIISYNHCHGTTGQHMDGWGMIGIAQYGGSQVMIERNTIHDHGARNQRPPIHCKSEYEPESPSQYVVIRENHIYDEPYNSGWDYGIYPAIFCSRNFNYYWIYRNRAYNVGGGGVQIELNAQSSGSDGTDGTDVHDVYIWGNEIAHGYYGIEILSTASSNTDDIYNIVVANNSIHQTLTGHALKGGFTYLARDNNTDDGTDPLVKLYNNIFSYCRYNSSPVFSLYSYQDGTEIDPDYNLWYEPDNPGGAKMRIGYTGDPCYSSPCEYDSGSVPSGWFDNATIGDPLFTSDSDLKLSSSSSPARGAGTDMSGESMPSCTIPLYGGTISHSMETIMSPNTNWTTVPPTIVTSSNPSDDVGAYVYSTTGDTTPPTVVGSPQINQGGTQFVVTLSENCFGNSGFTISPSGGSATLTYSSGTGTMRYYNTSRTIQPGETVTYSYTPGDIQDGSSNPLASITDQSVTNNATSSSEYICYGYPTTDCVPDSFTSGAPLGVNLDRKYARLVTFDQAGTIAVMSFHAYQNYCDWESAWLVVYDGSTLIGYSDPLGSAYDTDWQEDIPINVVGGQSLAVESSDQRYIGIAWDNDSSAATRFYYDSGTSTTPIYYDNTNAVESTPGSATWTTLSGYYDAAFVVGIETVAESSGNSSILMMMVR